MLQTVLEELERFRQAKDDIIKQDEQLLLTKFFSVGSPSHSATDNGNAASKTATAIAALDQLPFRRMSYSYSLGRKICGTFSATTR
jgi:hypothetical protein